MTSSPWLKLTPVLALSFLVVASCGDDDDDGGGGAIVACDGDCTCEPELDKCSCLGGTTCVADCKGPCTIACEGNARCDIECPANCTLECPGTAGCEARVGDDSQGVCNGTGFCDVVCEGDCSFDCPGSAKCILRCAAGHQCEITSCGGPAGVTECPDGSLACRTACPAPDGGAPN